MKLKVSLVLVVMINAMAAFSQMNKVVLLDFESKDILTAPGDPTFYDFSIGLKTINHDADKQATAGSTAFLNYYCEEDYVGIHLITDLFDPNKTGHADWSKFSKNAYLTFRVNTNNGGPVSTSIGWDNATYSAKYWASRNFIIDTQGEWKRYSIKLSDVVWRDSWGKGEVTYPDLSVAPKNFTLTFDDPDEEIAITPHVNVSIDDVEIWDEPLDAPLKAEAGNDVQAVCGSRVQLGVQTNYPSSKIISYLWSPSEGLSEVNIPNPTATVSSNSKYKVTVTLPDGSSATDSVNVNILPLRMSLNVPVAACGNSTQITLNTNYTGTKALKYKWTPAEGLSCDTIPNPLVTLSAPIKYSVQVTTPVGCTADSSFMLTPSMIAVQPSICMVTVDEDDKNVIVCQRDQTAAIESFYIFRESILLTNQYDLIGVISNLDTNEFKDLTSNARVQSNKYKIAIKDVCGFMTTQSPEHKTMHLMASKGAGNNWNLMWEPYLGAPVSNYKIFRGTSKSDLIQIGTTSGSNISYTDETAPAGDVYYQVAVEVNQSCTGLKSAGNNYIRSNIFSSKELSTNTGTIPEMEALTFPNPASDVLHVKTSGSPNVVLLLFDLYGRQFPCKPIDTQTIDISNLSSGIYTLKIIDSGAINFSKFVKK